jgi:hypothetical protein
VAAVERFELLRFGRGGLERPSRRVTCGLDEAIATARTLVVDDPLRVVEVRRRGETLCTVGQGWVSRKRTWVS